MDLTDPAYDLSDSSCHDNSDDCNVICPIGRYSDESSPLPLGICTPCPAGRYLADGKTGAWGGGFVTNAHDSIEDCQPCGANLVSREEAAGSCSECPDGTEPNEDQTGCVHEVATYLEVIAELPDFAKGDDLIFAGNTYADDECSRLNCDYLLDLTLSGMLSGPISEVVTLSGSNVMTVVR